MSATFAFQACISVMSAGLAIAMTVLCVASWRMWKASGNEGLAALSVFVASPVPLLEFLSFAFMFGKLQT